MERRLAAILSADVVGYSRLMEADEDATKCGPAGRATTSRKAVACSTFICALSGRSNGRC